MGASGERTDHAAERLAAPVGTQASLQTSDTVVDLINSAVTDFIGKFRIRQGCAEHGHKVCLAGREDCLCKMG